MTEPSFRRSEQTTVYGYPQWMEGPTDPESPWEGRPVRLEAVTTVPGGGIEPGTVIGRFAGWHFGGRQPANLLSTITVVDVRRNWKGRADVSFTDGSALIYDRPETLYKVCWNTTRSGR